MKRTQMFTGRRLDDSVLYVHSRVLFSHGEWHHAVPRKMDRITGHYGKLHKPDKGIRGPVSSLKCESVFKKRTHPLGCRVVITKLEGDWDHIWRNQGHASEWSLQMHHGYQVLGRGIGVSDRDVRMGVPLLGIVHWNSVLQPLVLGTAPRVLSKNFPL